MPLQVIESSPMRTLHDAELR